MPKDATPPPPPEPQLQYAGYPWLGSQWGRSGNPTPPRIGAVFAFIAALVVAVVAVRAVVQDRALIFVIASFAIAAVCALAGYFFLKEAAFAKRAAQEQTPFKPSLD